VTRFDRYVLLKRCISWLTPTRSLTASDSKRVHTNCTHERASPDTFAGCVRHDLVNEKRGISPEIAVRPSKVFGGSQKLGYSASAV